MNESQLGKALLLQHAIEDASLGASPQQITLQVLQRDRRRVWWLVGFTLVLWIVVVGGFLITTYFYLVYVHPQVVAGMREGSPAEMANTWDMLIRYVVYWLSGVFVVFLLAAFSTVLLVFFSRQATLRQVNASLFEISTQLKQLGDGRQDDPIGSAK